MACFMDEGRMDGTTSLWLQTAAMISVAAGALWLHLRWHPRRREFSEGWDFLSGMPWLVVLHGALLVLGQMIGGEAWITGRLTQVDVWTWRDIAAPLFTEALFEVVTLPHALFPVWPWALLLPVAMALLTWRVMRYPYRYGPRRQLPAERWLLLAGMVLSWGWLALEVTPLFRAMPEWAEMIRIGLRVIFQAVAMALTQVVLVRLVIAWMEPEHPDDQRDLGLAIEHTFARWRGVAGLALLDLLILLLQSANEGGLLRWVLLEVLLLFLLVPAAVARVPGALAFQGMAALRGWARAWFSILGVLITSVCLLAVVRYASAAVLEITGMETWRTLLLLPVHGLVLATVRTWVFLALVLTLLRHGLIPSTTRGRAAL